jgi:hypothetical protein
MPLIVHEGHQKWDGSARTVNRMPKRSDVMHRIFGMSADSLKCVDASARVVEAFASPSTSILSLGEEFSIQA